MGKFKLQLKLHETLECLSSDSLARLVSCPRSGLEDLVNLDNSILGQLCASRLFGNGISGPRGAN